MLIFVMLAQKKTGCEKFSRGCCDKNKTAWFANALQFLDRFKIIFNSLMV